MHQFLAEAQGNPFDRFVRVEILAYLQQSGRVQHFREQTEAQIFGTLRSASHRSKLSLEENAFFLMAWLRYSEFSASGLPISLHDYRQYFIEQLSADTDAPAAYHIVSSLANKETWLVVKVTRTSILLEQLSLTSEMVPWHKVLEVHVNETSVPFREISETQL